MHIATGKSLEILSPSTYSHIGHIVELQLNESEALKCPARFMEQQYMRQSII